MLPPADERPLRLLGLSGTIVQQYHQDTITAILSVSDPDAVVATPPASSSVTPFLRRTTDQPILMPGRGVRPDVHTLAADALVVALGSDGEPPALAEATEDDQGGQIESEELVPRCIITSDLSLSVDPYERTTTLKGLDKYRETIPGAWQTPRTTHLSTALRPGFVRTICGSTSEQTTVVGIGQTEAQLGAGADVDVESPALVEIYSNGFVDVNEVDPESVGLRGITEVAHNRAQTLREAGYTSPADLATTRISEIANLDGLGSSTANTIHASATAQVEQRVVATGDGALPNGDPVFIDIETDGLEASTAWLIGVLDGDAEDGHYLAFRQREPGEGSHLEAFMTWLTGSAESRPVVAWNGLKFDFPVITDQLRHHCPEHLDAWDSTYTFDPLYWAREKGNAALPGRSNQLEDVAEALGWEPTTNGIDGATVAKVYVAWRDLVKQANDPAQVPDPDWDRLEAYCEDDVRALATIYDGLREAARRKPEDHTPTGEDSTQGALSDFS
jgi:uncharacterized protein YprB with RNaseH-like and TPR domain